MPKQRATFGILGAWPLDPPMGMVAPEIETKEIEIEIEKNKV